SVVMSTIPLSHRVCPLPLHAVLFLSRTPPPPTPTLFPYTTLFRSRREGTLAPRVHQLRAQRWHLGHRPATVRLRAGPAGAPGVRSEEHTSELQSRENLVCRLLLEKKKQECNERIHGHVQSRVHVLR